MAVDSEKEVYSLRPEKFTEVVFHRQDRGDMSGNGEEFPGVEATRAMACWGSGKEPRLARMVSQWELTG